MYAIKDRFSDVLQPQKASFNTELHQSDAVRAKLACGTGEANRIISVLKIRIT